MMPKGGNRENSGRKVGATGKEKKKPYTVYLYPSVVERLGINPNKVINSAVRDLLDKEKEESK